MPVIASDLIELGAANRPEDDVSTSGGAIDTAARPLDNQPGSAVDVEILSDGADTRGFVLTYRNAAGSIQTWSPTLNGTTPVALGSAVVARILKGELASGDASRTVTLRVVSGGATLHVFNPNETDAFTMFQRSSSAATQQDFYEKTFIKNTNANTDLQDAEVTLISDPSAKFTVAVDATKDATTSVANRKTTPGLTEQDNGVAIAVPTGTLAFGEAIGVWRHMQLAADAAADMPTSQVQISGQTI